MSARVNLAPEVYQKSQESKRRKKLATSITVGIGVIGGGFVVVMLLLLGAQKATIAVLSGDIKTKQDEIQQRPDLVKAATAQQHLKSWNDINGSKTKTSRFFEILEEFVPQGVGVQSVTVTNTNQLEMDGSAKSYALVTKLVKALEAANVEIGKNASATGEPYFKNIQLSSVQKDASGAATYKLSVELANEVTNGK